MQFAEKIALRDPKYHHVVKHFVYLVDCLRGVLKSVFYVFCLKLVSPDFFIDDIYQLCNYSQLHM